MIIRLLLIAVLGLAMVLFITLQKNSALRYEVSFLTTHYELLTGNHNSLKQLNLEALVKARVLQLEIAKLKTSEPIRQENPGDETTSRELDVKLINNLEFNVRSKFKGY